MYDCIRICVLWFFLFFCACYAPFCGRLKVISPVWDGRGLYTAQHEPFRVIVYRTHVHAIPDMTGYHRRVLYVAKSKILHTLGFYSIVYIGVLYDTPCTGRFVLL